MRNRPFRPLTLVWAIAVLLALALGFVIGGNPAVAKEVPLRDRKVVTTTTTTAPPLVTTTTFSLGGSAPSSSTPSGVSSTGTP